MQKQFFPLVFGGGVERASGTTTVPMQLMRTAENVYLGNGKVEPRAGLAQRADLTGDYVPLVHASRVRNEGIEVAVTGTIAYIKKTGGDGNNPTNLGTWLNPHLSQEDMRAIAAESGGRVFVAHEERILSRRGRTVFYDPNVNTTTFYALLAPTWAPGGLVPGGANDYVRFRGVTPWLDYLVGWGFGTNEVDAPEMVRISNPGDPLTFEASAWILAGQQGDPVQACLGVPGGLLVYKEAETYMIRGSDRSNFGIDLADALFGLAAPRLAVVVGDIAYAWSLEGPRRNRGGLSEDISWPLGLPWPTAEDIASSGRMLAGFAAYMPEKRMILFVFEDWVYAYSPDDQKWAHWRMGQKAHSGGILYPIGGYVGSSRGYPSYDPGATANTTDTIYAHYRNNLQEGDETVEVWYRNATLGGAWSKHGEQGVAITPTRFAITLLSAGTQYEVAFRYTRQGVASPGYEGDPAGWPSASKGYESTAAPGTVDLAGSYAFDSVNSEHEVTLTWTPPSSNATYKVLRDDVQVATLVAGTATWQDIWVAGTRASATEHKYTLVVVYPDATEVPNSVIVQIGNQAEPTVTLSPQSAVNIDWVDGSVAVVKDPGQTTEVEIWTEEWSDPPGATTRAFALDRTLAVTVDGSIAFTYYQYSPVPSGGTGFVQVYMQARYKYTAANAAVTYGPYSNTVSVILDYASGGAL